MFINKDIAKVISQKAAFLACPLYADEVLNIEWTYYSSFAYL